MIWLLLLGLFSYEDVLHTDLVRNAKIRWSRVDSGQRIVVEIDAGTAKRTNPNWSPQSQELAYDLDKERALEKVIKWAKLPSPRKAPSASDKDRTLEILVEDAKGYRSAGFWSMSVKAWQKGRYGSIFDPLEELMNAKAELFEHKQGTSSGSGFVPK